MTGCSAAGTASLMPYAGNQLKAAVEKVQLPFSAEQSHSRFRVLVTFFGGTEGGNPNSSVILDLAGNVYGTTEDGGDLSCGNGLVAGCGVVFKIDTTGREIVLHRFHRGPTDGQFASSSAFRNAAGDLFGVTSEGGTLNQGAVYELKPGDNERILYSFQGGTDGRLPDSALVRDHSGNFYGTTFKGGNTGCQDNYGDGCGVVYKLTPSGKESVLYRFTGGADGGIPWPNLVIDGADNLYGTTSNGGDLNCNPSFLPGCGVIYKLNAHGVGPCCIGSMEIAAEAAQTPACSWTRAITSTARPITTAICRVDVRDPAGNLYGTTTLGGRANCPQQGLPGCGTVFKIDASGHETILYGFADGPDGEGPATGLARDLSGSLYGTTSNGISNAGAIFKLMP